MKIFRTNTLCTWLNSMHVNGVTFAFKAYSGRGVSRLYGSYSLGMDAYVYARAMCEFASAVVSIATLIRTPILHLLTRAMLMFTYAS